MDFFAGRGLSGAEAAAAAVAAAAAAPPPPSSSFFLRLPIVLRENLPFVAYDQLIPRAAEPTKTNTRASALSRESSAALEKSPALCFEKAWLRARWSCFCFSFVWFGLVWFWVGKRRVGFVLRDVWPWRRAGRGRASERSGRGGGGVSDVFSSTHCTGCRRRRMSSLTMFRIPSLLCVFLSLLPIYLFRSLLGLLLSVVDALGPLVARSVIPPRRQTPAKWHLSSFLPPWLRLPASRPRRAWPPRSMGMGPLFRRELRCEAPVSYRVDVDRKREAKQREKAHARETSRCRRICGAGLRPKRCSSLSLFLFSLSFALSSSTTKCIGSNKQNLVFSPSPSLSSPPVDPSNSAESSRALERGR